MFRRENDVPHQVKSWFGDVAAKAASHPGVEALASKWLQIKTEREPVLADFWQGTEEGLTANSILFLKGEDDYTYLHHGRALRERIGFSMQGRTLSELRTRIRPQLLEIYDRSVAEFVLAYFQSFSDFSHEVTLWGRLCLPLRVSVDDPRAALLLYCHPIEDKNSLFRAAFERSHAGIVICAPIRDEKGTLTDGWLVAQNERANAITGVVDHANDPLLLRAGPWLRGADVWSALTGPLPGGIGRAVVKDPVRGMTVPIEMELIEDYLVVRFGRDAAPPPVFDLS